jgi:predicted Zn-dependent protease with MMP-like domain
MGSEDLQEEFAVATAELLPAIEKYAQVQKDKKLEFYYEDGIRNLVVDVLDRFGYPVSGRARVRLIYPKGTLLRMNTAGIYIPFTGEGHVDAGLLPEQIPAVLAHEMAHCFGIAGEGSCNFISWMACRDSDDPLVHMSGLLSYWRYVASAYSREFPDLYKQQFSEFPEQLKTLLAEIRENNAKYPDILPKLQRAVHDSYLKSHGIKEGRRSYSTVIQLVHAFRKIGNQDL